MTLPNQLTLARSLFRLTWPSLLLAAMQASLAIVDASLASHLGLDHLAAISVVYPFYLLMQIVALGGFGGAVAAHVARAAGAREAGLVRQTAIVAMGLSLVIGLACSLAYFCFGELLSRRLLDPRQSGLALDYGCLLIGMAPVLWACNCAVSIARGLGLMRQTLWSACIALPMQAVGISVGVLLLGVQAIAALSLATILGNLGLGLLVGARLLRHPMLEWSPQGGVGQRRRILRSLASVGLFTSASSIMTGLALITLSGIAAARFGRDALSAYGLVMRVEVTMMLLMGSVGAAVVTTCAGALGRRDSWTTRQAAGMGVAACVVVVGLMGILGALHTEWLLRPFSITPAVQAYAANYLVVVGWTFPLMALGFSSLFVGQGLHRPWPFFAAAAARFAFLLAATRWGAQTFQSFSAVVASGYGLFGGLAAIGLLREGSRLGKGLPR
jgi:Na+-driven multidrug efflux pump